MCNHSIFDTIARLFRLGAWVQTRYPIQDISIIEFNKRRKMGRNGEYFTCYTKACATDSALFKDWQDDWEVLK